MVHAGLIEPHGLGRWTSYSLRVPRDATVTVTVPSEEEQILAHVKKNGSITSAECQKLLGLDGKKAWYRLKRMTESKQLKPQGEGRWRRYVLP